MLEKAVPVFSPPTFSELKSRLWLPIFDRYLTLELRRSILHDLNAASLWIDLPPEIACNSLCRDHEDDMFIHTALAAKAMWLVTGDKDLLELSSPPGLRILSPAAALGLSEPPWNK